MRLAQILLAGAAFALAAAVGGQAAADTINFDDLGNGVVVTNQYAQATFSSNPGFQILTTAQNLGSSLPNFICTGAGSIDCAHDVFVNFTNPVNTLSFVATGANDTGVIGQVKVYVGGLLDSTININGAGTPFTPVLVDLSAFTDVTGITIFNVTDAAGLGYDDFTFNAGGGVPEPASWALMLLGFGAIGLTARRGRKALLAA